MSHYMKADQLLPSNILLSLTVPSRSLYEAVWNRMAQLGRPEFSQLNHNTSVYARLTSKGLVSAQKELASAGLMEIQFDERPDVVTPNQLVRYTFPAKSQEAAD